MPKSEPTTLSRLQNQVGKAVASLRRLATECGALSDAGDTEARDAVEVLRDASASITEALTLVSGALMAATRGFSERLETDADSYSARLVEALEATGHRVKGDPTRPVVNARVYIDVAHGGAEVKVNGQLLEERHPRVVVGAVDRALQDIERRLTPSIKFLAALESAYQEELAAIGASAGAQVKVGDLHYRMMLERQSSAFRRDPRASAFKEYPLEVFRADLHDALAAGLPTRTGRELKVASGSDTSGAVFMLIPALGRPGYAGRLWFERSAQ